MTFAGFPSRAQATAIPNVFFTDLLPQLAGDPAAAGIALYALQALQARRGFPRYITAGDLRAEPSAMRYIEASGADTAAIERGLARCAEIGMLLPLSVDRSGQRHELYFLNTPADRRGMAAVRSGEVDLGRVVQNEAQSTVRETIFALYESTIGAIPTALIDELTEAQRLYPADWLQAAFREAAAQNARSWRYVSRILERWASEGPDHATTERDPDGSERYLRGKYGGIIRRRLAR